MHYVSAQYDYIWAFGENAGLDFTNGNPVPIEMNIGAVGFEFTNTFYNIEI